MFRLNYALALIAIVGPLVALLAAACIGDPGTELTLHVTNRTDRLARVTVPKVLSSSVSPPREEQWMDLLVEPGETKEAKKIMDFGARAGPVRAYAEGKLIFCQSYEYHVAPESGLTWRIEIVEGHVACQ